jgi:Hypervirulence associated proteins TUDOR domain
MAGKSLRKGRKVSWRSHGQTVHGTVQEKITKRTEAAGRTVDASAEQPQYRVTSDRTGRDAVHKPGALHPE